jgi:hypothetical protein
MKQNKCDRELCIDLALLQAAAVIDSGLCDDLKAHEVPALSNIVHQLWAEITKDLSEDDQESRIHFALLHAAAVIASGSPNDLKPDEVPARGIGSPAVGRNSWRGKPIKARCCVPATGEDA